MKKKRWYVVWAGHNPGIYDDWADAREQVEGFPQARYKGFDSAEEATEAYRGGLRSERGELGRLLAGAGDNSKKPTQPDNNWRRFPEVDTTAWAVDASCLGNPGRMEYRGVDLATGQEIFRVGPFEGGTNNIGEFLAIVHALALQEQRGESHRIYSDSVSGMAWVRRRKANTKLKPTAKNSRLMQLIARAELWLASHTVSTPVLKWDTDRWGEIPADFGRK